MENTQQGRSSGTLVKLLAGLLVTCLLVFVAAWLIHGWLQQRFIPPDPAPSRALAGRDLTVREAPAHGGDFDSRRKTVATEYDPDSLLAPPRQYGPWAWWWWPGGDVSEAGLVKQIEELDTWGFAGFELEPFTGFIDLNHDGQLDVVSSTEGEERTVYAHFSPSGPNGNLTASPWITGAFPVLQKASQWMFALPLQIDQKRGVDLVVGSKGASGQIGWLQAPEDGEALADWKWHRLAQADWVMSLRSLDLNGDGLTDIAFSQRNGPESGIWWLENPGPERLYQPWKKRYVAGKGAEVMFMDYGDLNADGREDFIAATRDGDLVAAYRERAEHPRWKEESIPMPGKAGTGKAVVIGHIDGDGVPDLVVTCENAENATGVFWMKRGPMGKWEAREISGREEGVKFDRIELIDLDGDNDLDVLTCEERHNLGVIWYENPAL